MEGEENVHVEVKVSCEGILINICCLDVLNEALNEGFSSRYVALLMLFAFTTAL